MTTLTLRCVRGEFLVAGPDIEPGRSQLHLSERFRLNSYEQLLAEAESAPERAERLEIGRASCRERVFRTV